MNWLRSVFSERDGTGSSSRTLCGLIVVAAIAWVSVYVWVHKALPAPADLEGLGGFIWKVCGALYGLNQLGATGQAWAASQASKTGVTDGR